MKTLIELYDSCHIENVIAGLSFKPEKIVFVGFKQNMKNKQCNDLKKFFSMKNLDICIEYEYVSRYDYDSIVDRLNAIIDSNADCGFDLTGGKELVLVAMGAISAARNIPMFQFDIRSGDLICVSNCENLPQIAAQSMTIEECVVLSGGAVVKDTDYSGGWDMNSDFCRDIETIWNISRRNSSAWNRNSIILSNLEKHRFATDSLYISCELPDEESLCPDTNIMKSLEYAGLIKGYKPEKKHISFMYKNEQVHRCISKAGNILELYVYMLAREISREQDLYNDIGVGVTVDWDGVIHDEWVSSHDTRNEIDVICMRNLVPVFISCKNGMVQKEALYELQAVARQFGGAYSKKILLTTYINKNRDARNFIVQRARDMKIEIIDGVDKLSREELKKALCDRAR